jgi:hypothetical protein
MEFDNLPKDCGIVAQLLGNAMIERKLSTHAILTGIQAFLMALHSVGRANPGILAEELFEMSEHFYALSVGDQGSKADQN